MVKKDFTPPTEDTPVEPVQEVKDELIGTVVNTNALNVREKPTKKSNPVALIFLNDRIETDGKIFNREWIKVRTEDGDEGFCMREYINLYT